LNIVIGMATKQRRCRISKNTLKPQRHKFLTLWPKKSRADGYNSIQLLQIYKVTKER